VIFVGEQDLDRKFFLPDDSVTYIGGEEKALTLREIIRRLEVSGFPTVQYSAIITEIIRRLEVGGFLTVQYSAIITEIIRRLEVGGFLTVQYSTVVTAP
jgi:hypothetical protein